jgi:hypothetical protein
MEFTQKVLIDRILQLDKYKNILRPTKKYYSSPDYSETAIYYGSKTNYEDIVDFYIAILCWVSADTDEFADIRIGNVEYYNMDRMICELQDLQQNDVLKIIKLFTDLNITPLDLIPKKCYKMSNEWHDIRYLFEYEDFYLLYNWYTGE